MTPISNDQLNAIQSYLPNGGKVAGVTDLNQPKQLVALVFQWLIALSAVIFLLMILSAGVRWLFSGGSEETITQAKKTLLNAIIGLVIVLAAYGLGLAILRLLGVIV